MATVYDHLKPVESSMFSRIGYDDENWQFLFQFRSTGEIRAYSDVSPEVAEAILKAPSIGKYYNAEIKGNSSWEFEVLGADPAEQKQAESKPAEKLTVMDEDIRLVEPGWNGTTIETVTSPQSERGGFFSQEYEASKTEIVTQPKGEVLPAWEPPKTATEAITLSAERKTEIDAIIKQSTERGQQALALKVNDQATHASVGESLTEMVKAKDRAMGLLDPFRALLYDAYVMANNFKKAAVEPLEKGIDHIKRQLNAYEFQQEQIRQQQLREEQERADTESRRLQAEQSQQLTLSEIQDAIDVGDTEKAEGLAAQPIEVPRPYVAPAPIAPSFAAPKGQGTRANWKVNEETADMVKFLTAVKNGEIDIPSAAKYVTFDFSALNKLAKAMQEAFKIPGLTAWNDPVRSVRRGK